MGEWVYLAVSDVEMSGNLDGVQRVRDELSTAECTRRTLCLLTLQQGICNGTVSVRLSHLSTHVEAWAGLLPWARQA